MHTVEYPGEIETKHNLPEGTVLTKPDSLVFSAPLKVEIADRRFVSGEDTTVIRNLIKASATLANPTDKPIMAYFWLGTFNLKLLEDTVVRLKPRDPGIPLMPAVPPPPFRIIIPAQTMVKFTDWVYPDEYVYEGTPMARLEWTMRFAEGPQPTGNFRITLPSR